MTAFVEVTAERIGDVTLIQADALTALGRMQAGSVDCIVTDPPYESLNKWRSIGTTTRLGGHRDADRRAGWFETISNEDLYACLCEFARVLPRNGHAWVMADGETMPLLCGYVREGETGFGYCKPYPVLKRAATGGYRAGMGYHGRSSHEYVVLCEKGRRRFTEENWPDVFEAVWTGDAESRAFTPDGGKYPTAKPVSLFARWIELSTREGETVLDPFAGSGTTGAAALMTQRRAICIDSSGPAIETMRRRFTALAETGENYALCPPR